jgi:CO/xanthine dehydrogenase Mo-binding subunit
VIDWSHEVYSHTHFGRALPIGARSNLLAAWDLDPPHEPGEPRPALDANGGIHRNAQPIYAFPRVRVVKHFVERAPLRVSALRGLGSYANLFAIESFMDELAERAGADPLAFRLAHLQDPRARAVLEAAAQRAQWRRAAQGGRGQGLAVTRYKNSKAYAALVVDVEVDIERGAIRLLRAVIAADAGEIVDPDGLQHQLEGGFLQAASWTLKEAVRFDARRVTSRDWESYPILTFEELPEQIETVLLDRPGARFLGAGEVTQGITPAAIANAVAHASGLRLREIPFTPERVMQERARARV